MFLVHHIYTMDNQKNKKKTERVDYVKNLKPKIHRTHINICQYKNKELIFLPLNTFIKEYTFVNVYKNIFLNQYMLFCNSYVLV